MMNPESENDGCFPMRQGAGEEDAMYTYFQEIRRCDGICASPNLV